MTFLEICKAVHRMMGGGEGQNPGTIPTTVVSQAGLPLRIVEEVKNAWIELQMEQSRWAWRTTTGTINAVASASSVQITTTLTTFEHLIPYTGDGDRPYILVGDETTNANQFPCYVLAWEDFQGYYNRDPLADATAAKPQWCAVRWAAAVPYLHWFPALPSTAGAVLNLQYRTQIETLAADATVPAMPAQFHNLIAIRALQNLSGLRTDSSQYQVMDERRKLLEYALRRDQLPPMVDTCF